MLREWLPDKKAAGAVIGCVLFLIGFLGVLPRWLRAKAAVDLGGVSAQTAPGIVSAVQISPVSQGGGGLFNGVDVSFAGHQAYYALPPSSKWNPIYGQNVTVTYRVGRQTGLVQVDAVEPIQDASFKR